MTEKLQNKENNLPIQNSTNFRKQPLTLLQIYFGINLKDRPQSSMLPKIKDGKVCLSL